MFLRLPPLGWCTHLSALVWLIGSLLVLCVAADRAPAPWVMWVMYTLGLVACPVGLGAGYAGWAVARANFVRSWVRGGEVVPCLRCRFGAGGFIFLVAVCAGRLPPAGGGGVVPTDACWPLARAWWAGVVLSHGCWFLSRV